MADLRESNERFRAFLDHALSLAFVKGTDGRYLYVNRRFEEAFRFDQSSALGRTDVELFSREQAAQFQAHDRQVLESGQAAEFEETAEYGDGRHTSIVVKFPLRDQTGQIYGIGGIVTDITGRKRAEDALREKDDLSRAFLENSSTVAWMKDSKGRYVYVSGTCERRFGIPRETWLGKTDFDLWPHEYAEQFRKNDLAVLEQNKAVEVIDESRSVDGEYSCWLSHRFPYQDSTGQRFSGGLAVEITDLKLAEEALAERARLSDFIAEVSLQLNLDEPLEQLLQRCAESVVNRLRIPFSRIWVLGPGDLCANCHKAQWCKDRTQCLHLKASAGLSTNLNGEYRRVPLGSLKIGMIALGAGALATNNILHDDRLPNKQWMKEHGLRSFAGYPLIVEGRVFGVLALFGKEPLSKVTLQAVESACHGLAAAIAQRQAEGALRQHQLELTRHRAQLQEMARKLLTAQESERQRLSRELHDDFSQRLAALVLDVAALEHQPRLSEVTTRALELIREQLEGLADDVHNLAYKLHPSLLVHAGLQPAIEDHIYKVASRTGLRIHLNARSVPGSLSLDQTTCLFRVLQESLQNIVKHANATEVTVKLRGSPHGMGLSVTDNGAGFDSSDTSAHQKGLGLVSMEERLHQLNGCLQVHSRPADGTKVCAWIPSGGGNT